MKTLRRFLQVVCLSAVLVITQSTAYAVIYEEIIDFTYPNSLPISVSGGIEVEYWVGPGNIWERAWRSAWFSGNEMILNTGNENPLGYCTFNLEPAPGVPSDWHLIGFGMAAQPGYQGFEQGVLGGGFSHSLQQTTGLSWSMSDVPPASLSGPSVFADPGSYITSYESYSMNIHSYYIPQIELFWDVPEIPVPDGGNVLLPFLLTLIGLLGSHQLSRVQRLSGQTVSARRVMKILKVTPTIQT